MPYNIPQNLGGDSPENTRWIEECVNSITGINKRTRRPYTKGEKIAICKTMLREKKSREDAELLINGRINQLVLRVMRNDNLTFNQAQAKVLALCNKYEFDFDRVLREL